MDEVNVSDHILIIDSNLISQRRLSWILSNEGFSCTVTSHAMDALPLIVENQPSLILMDMVLQGIDSLEFCQILKENSETKDIPIIIVSSKTRGSDVKQALFSGAFDFIKKPIDELEVVARVRSALRHRNNELQLKNMSMRDSMTGLFNHGLIMELLSKELYNCYRKQRPLSYVMMDVDHFKSINDNYGHQVGDFVLKTLARLFEETLRRGDYLGRYGGEEFAIIFPGLEKDLALMLCERLRKSVEEHRFVYHQTSIPVTISIGGTIATPIREYSSKEVVQSADRALYLAKESGRNQVQWVD